MAEPVVQMTRIEYVKFWKTFGVWMAVGFTIAVTTGILIAAAINLAFELGATAGGGETSAVFAGGS